MASIKGVTLKNIQKFRGHDGENYYQGNIYFKGKGAVFRKLHRRMCKYIVTDTKDEITRRCL